MIGLFDTQLQQKPPQTLKHLLVTLGQFAIDHDDLVTWALVSRLVSGGLSDA
jgi:hypothetical protein